MKHPAPFSPMSRRLHRLARSAIVQALGWSIALPAFAFTSLADQPLFTNTAVPGNVALALSVEYPTAVRTAHTGTYSAGSEFLGYFDPNKCYVYRNLSGSTTDDRYFVPDGLASGRTCSGKWSGNFLNWATMQTVDPFRWALTGGYRKHDTTTLTVLERAWQSGQGSLFPDRSLSGSALVSGATPFSSTLQIRNNGNRIVFTTASSLGSTLTHYTQGASDNSRTYEAYVRVKVCDPSTAVGGVESNCRQYGSNWKPEGLIQQYANRMRFSAFGYLNQDGTGRDGGVLRARQKYVGPQQPVPGQPAVANAAREWDPTTGVFVLNPDSTDAARTNTLFAPSTAVANSGVMNYLNKFGQINPGNYKSNDPVGELYYAAIRYFRNLGNVPEWSNMTGQTGATKTTWIDGFPVITEWDDPIQYSCQKNFILGIGDVYTHADKNVPGNTNNANEPAMPSLVASDTAFNAVTSTNRVGVMQGLGANLGTTHPINGCCSNNSARMAGLAYQANVQDIRPDNAQVRHTIGKQTVQTLWVDVLERAFEPNNQFYLAAKYGGFAVPDNYDFARTTALPEEWWATTADTVGSGTTSQRRPDNYYTAGRPDQMVSGLTRAFANIAAQLRAYTTSFSTSLPQVSLEGNSSYSSQYDSSNWTAEIIGSEMTFDETTGAPTTTQRWLASERMATQFSGTGWNTARRVVTWNPTSASGVPFRRTNLTTTQVNSLNTSYRTGDDSSDYLNYLRGDRTYEQSSTTPANRFYRTRARLLGDIVGSKTRPVGPPSLNLWDQYNPGYSTFKGTWSSRPTVVYVGANDGMLHALDGNTASSNTTGGRELFAFIPNALFQGPNNTPNVNGLAALGNPDFAHHFYVNATPTAYDIDMSRTVGASTTTGPQWKTVLIGGLGKGGRSYYAIDVTDPAGMTTEAAVASKVLWEFTDPDMGYTFGEPAVVKTRKYGWVVILPSGYNNADGRGYFFLVNPRTGQLLEKVSTGAGDTAHDAGLAHLNTFVNELGDGTADAAYAGDMLGNVWRLDLTTTTGAYTAPLLLARLTTDFGDAQPVTSRPRIEVHPRSRARHVLFGTGRLLDTSDLRDQTPQAFYAIADGNNDRFSRSGDLPTGVSFPLLPSNLAPLSDPREGLTDPPANTVGWRFALGNDSTTNIAWRVILEPDHLRGIVAFASILPTGDACNPSGLSRVYGLDYGSGRTVLLDRVGGDPIAFRPISGVVTDLKFLSVSGTPRLIGGTDSGTLESIPGNFTLPSALRRINWRELRIVE